MRHYFIHNGEHKKGPCTLEELKAIGLTSETKVWYDGLSDWTNAENIDELKAFILKSPPPLPGEKSFNDTIKKAKTIVETDYVDEIERKIPNKTGKRVFKISLIALSIFGLIFIINYFKPTKESKEKNNITDYLKLESAELNFNENISYWGIKQDEHWNIEGKIINNASSTTYKDVKLEVEFYTNTNTSLGKQNVIIYKIFKPRYEIENNNDENYTYFNVKLDQNPPKEINAENTKFKIIGADIYKKEEASQ